MILDTGEHYNESSLERSSAESYTSTYMAWSSSGAMAGLSYNRSK